MNPPTRTPHDKAGTPHDNKRQGSRDSETDGLAGALSSSGPNGSPPRRRPGRTGRAWAWGGLGAALAAAALLLGPVAFPGLLPSGPATSATEGLGPTDLEALATLLSGRVDAATLERLRPFIGPLAGGPDAVAPGDLSSLLALAAPPTERLPIPSPPPGDEPLVAALQEYAAAVGAPATAESLRPATAALRLAPEAEAALSSLVRAYLEALRLQQEATSSLHPSELALLGGDPQAIADWQARNPAGGLAELEAELLALGARVDQAKLVQAADLLARTVEAVRLPLALPPTPLDPAEAAAEAEALAAAGVRSSINDPWQAARALASASGAPPVLSWETGGLDQALQELAAAYGLAPANVPPGVAAAALPPSLDQALAGLVFAQAAGIRSGDAAAQAVAVLGAAQAAEPTLRAWSALLRPAGALEDRDAAAFLAVALGAAPAPSRLIAAAGGAPVAAPASLPSRPLADLLESEGVRPSQAEAAAASLPPAAALALALALEARSEVAAARAAVDAGLDDAQREALRATPEIAPLLGQPSWTPDEARRVVAWGEAMAAADPDALRGLESAQQSAVQDLELAARLLDGLTFSDLPLPFDPPVPLPQFDAAADLDPLCPADSPLSDCPNDAFLSIPDAGILVTGRGGSTIDARYGDPAIVIDLGGDDVHGESAAAGDATAPFSAVIDVAGRDQYRSPSLLAQGAAEGLGAVAALLDLAGDDAYDHSGAGTRAGAQGYASNGGLGLLLDAGGNDTYASSSMAQGVGLSPLFAVRAAPGAVTLAVVGNLTGTGLLVDLGQGADRFTAREGQGHSNGVGTTGVLLDQQGATNYTVTRQSLASQGGRGPGTDWSGFEVAGRLRRPDPPVQPGGLAALIDLGGAGDSYSSPDFPVEGVRASQGWVVQAPAGDARKGDDVLWSDLGNALAFGIDSSTSDSDGDRFPDLAELLALSDPQDPASTPAQSAGPLVAQLAAAAADVLTFTRDTDSDGFPDAVEATAGSDPADPNSTPVAASDPGLLLEGPLLCPGEDDEGCGNAGASCDPATMACVSLFALGSPDPTTHTRRSLVSIDLGGADDYQAPIAWEGSVWTDGQVRTFGSTSLDLDGDDRYVTPNTDRTQGYASNGASMLLDLAGNDEYVAREDSQAAIDAAKGAVGRYVFTVQTPIGPRGATIDGQNFGGAVAILFDLAGNDRYQGQAGSQGSATTADGTFDLQTRDRPTVATLLDVDGTDHYSFVTQASVGGHGGIGIVVDGFGSDHYESVGIAADPEGPREGLFETQGRVDVAGTTQITPTQVAFGAFIDVGPGADEYWTLTPSGELADVSSSKDAAGLIVNPVRIGDGAARAPTYAAAYFIDDPSTLVGDDDLDGEPNLAELLVGNDPRDADDSIVHLDSDGHPVIQAGLDGTVLGIVDGGKTLLNLPGLAIGGRDATTYADYSAFIVDLGGNDDYLSPYVGGTAQQLHMPHAALEQGNSPNLPPRFGSAGVALLLDIGSGRDEYRPEPCVKERTFGASTTTFYDPSGLPQPHGQGSLSTSGSLPTPLDITFCPSLGGAAAGVALLADDGGKNEFASAASYKVTGIGDDISLAIHAWGLTQGSALFSGVGMLATWDSTNTFHSSLDLQVRDEDDLPTGRAIATGLAQGASWGHALGILASFGGADDSYEVDTTAYAPRGAMSGATAEDLAQGASMAGIGILVDEGGDNKFIAPQGRSQGFSGGGTWTTGGQADPTNQLYSLGAMWAGPGDDTYVGGTASQASAGLNATPDSTDSNRDSHAIALLVDGGGNDIYRISSAPGPSEALLGVCPAPILPNATACALSQGAAAHRGLALLLDWAGDDVYDAATRSHVQGVAVNDLAAFQESRATSGTTSAFFLDLGGNDVHRAGAASQAYAFSTANQGSAEAVMLDLAGRDLHESLDRSQGFVELGELDGVPSGRGDALFADAGGVDVYGSEADDHADGATWTGGSGGQGHDVNELSAALAAAASNYGTLELAISPQANGANAFDEDAYVEGDQFLHATIQAAVGLEVQRVDFLRDGVPFGVGERVTGEPSFPQVTPNVERFRLAWPTAAEPDGPATFVANAFLAPVGDNDRWIGAPDGVTLESESIRVKVDNAPTGTASLSLSAIAPTLAGPTNRTTLTLDVSQDIELPSGVPAAGKPGAFATLELRRVGAGSVPFTAYSNYTYAGQTEVVYRGRCPASGEAPAPVCPDGRYIAEVVLEDARHEVRLPAMPLKIDSSAPESAMLLPAYLNAKSKVGQSGLSVQVSNDDIPSAPAGLTADDVSGVEELLVLQLDEDGAIVDTRSVSPSVGSTVFQGIGSGETVRFVSVAADALGNTESPCKAGEAAPCFRAKAEVPGAVKQAFVDFIEPEISEVDLAKQVIPPGTPVELTAKVSDAESGVDRVFVRIDGASIGGVANPVVPLVEGTPGTYSTLLVLDSTPGTEKTFEYFVTAVDVAGNENEQVRAATIDAKAPALAVESVDYFDGADAVEAARPGSKVIVRVLATDRAVDSMVADASAVDAPDDVTCLQVAGADWACEITVGASAADGLQPVLLSAVDEAGNTASGTAIVDVRGAPPGIQDARIVSVGYDHVVVAWNTTVPATTEADFGTEETRLSRSASVEGEMTQEHVLRITGLAPAKEYYIRPEPRSASHAPNLSADILRTNTTSAIRLALPGFPEGATLGGVQSFEAMVMSLAGAAPVSVQVRLESADGSSPSEAAPSFTQAPGPRSITVDLRRFPDGDYRLLLTGSRERDTVSERSPPFRLDNTAPALSPLAPMPETTLTDPLPTFRLSVSDPFGGPLPPLNRLALRVDGLALEPTSPQYESGPDDILRFGLPLRLADGQHVVSVRLADAGGNADEAEWSFRVDTAAPRLVGIPGLRQSPAAGGAQSLLVDLDVRDATGVAAVRVDLGPAGGAPVALLAQGPRWVGNLTLPADAPIGTLTLPVTAVDTLGNQGRAGELRVVSDRTAPTFTYASAQPGGLSSLVVTALTDEPAALRVLLNGTLRAEGPQATEHSFLIEGLRPGQDYALDAVATDGAGNSVTQRINATLAVDDLAPSALSSLVATSEREGVVRLDWRAAKDNAGIASYEVVRVLGDERTTLPPVPGNRTTATDPAAPAGHSVVYEVTAIDVAGLRGPMRPAVVRVLAVPRLSEATIFPETGPSDQPFDVSVVYTHAAGTPPETIELRYGNLSIPLRARGGDCAAGCVYGAEVRLPALLTLRSKPTVSVAVLVQGQVAEAPLEAPLVTLGDGELGVRAGDAADRGAPGLPWIVLVLAALAAAALRRKQRFP